MLLICGFIFSIVTLTDNTKCSIRSHPLMTCGVAVSCSRGADHMAASLSCSKRLEPDLAIESKPIYDSSGVRVAYVQCREEGF
jgi:hypothetical protein